jgi:23S rRNA (adenine2030-N6)-methyltransferase
VRADNPDGRLRRYPGSPRIARRFLRAGDHMILTELNLDDCQQLGRLFGSDRQVVVEHQDGYQALKAHLPPAERRGLVLIDSSFDRAQEFKRLTQGLTSAHRRFATGVYALWYPLMAPAVMHGFARSVLATGIRKILQLELSILPESWSASLRGSGMLVVNPPFEFEGEARSLLDWLWRALSPDHEGRAQSRWLVPE